MPAFRQDSHLKQPMTRRIAGRVSLLVAGLLWSAPALAQHATEVIDYLPGNAGAPFNTPESALGPPTRMSGIPGVLPSTVTPFQPAYGGNELVTIGQGGRLTVAFAEPVTDDPGNPFGIDLLIFGNAFFVGSSGPAPCATGLYEEPATIEVSADGITFVLIPGVLADGAFPTSGYQDSDAYATQPGRQETDFARPVDPGFLEFASQLCWEALQLAYDGSGGGVPIDLAVTGLTEIRFVRISTAPDAPSLPEIDAFSDVRAVADGVDADFDDDGVVGGADLALLLANWGGTSPQYDIVNDGVIDGADLTKLLSEWSS